MRKFDLSTNGVQGWRPRFAMQRKGYFRSATDRAAWVTFASLLNFEVCRLNEARRGRDLEPDIPLWAEGT